MEYVSLGDLERNVSEHSGKIPEIEARHIAEQILLGSKLMHAESFAAATSSRRYVTTAETVFRLSMLILHLLECLSRLRSTQIVGKTSRLRIE
jgi:hypothetical protein